MHEHISPLLGEHPRIVNICLGPVTIHYREVSMYCLRVQLKQDNISMWSIAFHDVAERILAISVEDFEALNDDGRKTVVWPVIGMKCNMTIGKTVGEMFTNYTVESVKFAGYLP